MKRREFISAVTLSSAAALSVGSPLVDPEVNENSASSIVGFSHVGLATLDIDRSIRFYRDLIGLKFLGEGRFDGVIYENITGLKGASGRIAMLTAGHVRLELFEYTSPQGQLRSSRSPADQGINHICFNVTDIEREYARLKKAGVSFHCAPQDGGFAKATYGRDPDDNIFELIEIITMPKGWVG